MPDALALVGPTRVQLLVFFCFSISVISYSFLAHRCFFSIFVWFLCSRRCCTDELETRHADWTSSCVYHGRTNGKDWGHVKSILAHLTPVVFCWPFQSGASAVVYYFCHCMSLHVRMSWWFVLLFWRAACSFFGKKLSFWFSACSV